MTETGTTQTIEDEDAEILAEEIAAEAERITACAEAIRIIRAANVETVGEAAALLAGMTGTFEDIYLDITDPIFGGQDLPVIEAIEFIRENY